MIFELAIERIWFARKWILCIYRWCLPPASKTSWWNHASWAIREEHQNAITSTELKGSWTTNKSGIFLHYFNWQSEAPNCIKGRRWSSCGCECLAYLTRWGCISIGGCSGTCRPLVGRLSNSSCIKKTWIVNSCCQVVSQGFGTLRLWIYSALLQPLETKIIHNLVRWKIHASWSVPGKLDGIQRDELIHESDTRSNSDNWRLFGATYWSSDMKPRMPVGFKWFLIEFWKGRSIWNNYKEKTELNVQGWTHRVHLLQSSSVHYFQIWTCSFLQQNDLKRWGKAEDDELDDTNAIEDDGVTFSLGTPYVTSNMSMYLFCISVPRRVQNTHKQIRMSSLG